MERARKLRRLHDRLYTLVVALEKLEQGRTSGLWETLAQLEPGDYTYALPRGGEAITLLRAAAGKMPIAAVWMLERGAEPSLAPEGTASLMLVAAWGLGVRAQAGALQLFARLRRECRAEDLDEPMVYRGRARRPYHLSLAAHVLACGSPEGGPFLAELLAVPGWGGEIRAADPGGATLSVEEFAARVGAGWAGPLLAARRWSPARAAWIAAVVRAR